MAPPERGEHTCPGGAHPVRGGQRAQQGVPGPGHRPHPGGTVTERPLPGPRAPDAGGEAARPGAVVGVRHVRIVVVTTFVPFRIAGADAPADALAEACRTRGVEVDRIRLPRSDGLALACRLTDVPGDRLLCLDPSAALLPHPAVRVWATDATGLDDERVRAAVAAAPAVHAATEAVRARLAEVGVAAGLLPVPVDRAAWDRTAGVLLR